MTHQIYTNTILRNNSDKKCYHCVDITNIIALYYKELSNENPNNIFFTTNELRDYHFNKQRIMHIIIFNQLIYHFKI